MNNSAAYQELLALVSAKFPEGFTFKTTSYLWSTPTEVEIECDPDLLVEALFSGMIVDQYDSEHAVSELSPEFTKWLKSIKYKWIEGEDADTELNEYRVQDYQDALCYSVISVNKRFYKAEWTYSSSGGYDFDGIHATAHEVVAKRVSMTVYE